MANLTQGDKVEWDWGKGTAEGTVEKTYTRKVTRKIKGSDVTRKGSGDNPAVFIRQADGGTVLKLASEVRKA
jgi:hypothetical protein